MKQNQIDFSRNCDGAYVFCGIQPGKFPRKVSLESRAATPSFCKFNCRLPVRAYTRFRLHSLDIGIFRDWSRKQALGIGKRLEGGSVVCN